MDSKEMELEDVRALRQLVQSPGWKLVQARLSLLLAEREREKAAFLRSGDVTKATIKQGNVDALLEVAALLDTLIKSVNVEGSNESPAY